MTVTDYLLHLFYLVDTEIQALNLPPLRTRGPRPTLADSEVITIELAGEFLGIDTDQGIWRHFRRYHLAEFPALADVNRTTFARQGAALWRVKQLLHARVLALLPLADPVDGTRCWIIDSFPLRICRLARAPRCKLFQDIASYGHDPTLPGNNHYFGLRLHLRASDRGPVAQLELTAARVPDLDAAVALAPPADGPREPCLGDRNYWCRGNPQRVWQLAQAGIELVAPFKQKSLDPHPRRSAVLTRLRQVIETVIGQLATRFHAERTWARDLWHLTARLARKVLSHTAAVLLNWRAGNPPLQLDLLVD